MKFLSQRANNFMSFKELDYIFPETGLYFVGGEVQDGVVSSSNRAGKSVFATEVLSWGLFGKTIRGMERADGVVHREVGENCFVEIIVEDDEGEYYVVKRYRKHKDHQNSLLLYKGEENITGADVYKTQKTIDEILGMSWLVFSKAVIFGEMAKRFIEAGDAEKKGIFDEILMLHYYQQAQQAVKADFNKLIEDKNTMETELGEEKAGLNEVGQEMQSVNDSLAELQEEKKTLQERVEEKTARVVGLDEKLKIAKGAHSEAKEDLKVLEEKNEELLSYVGKVRQEESEEMVKLQRATAAAHEKASPILFKIEELQEWLDNRDNLPKGARCKVCGSEITMESVVGCAKHYEKECAELRPQYAKLQEAHQEALKKEAEAAREWEGKLKDAEKAKSKLDVELGNQRDIIHQAENDMLRLENDVKIIKQEIEHSESEYREKETLFLKTKERLEEKVFGCEEKIEALGKKMIKVDEEAQYLKFWIEGFSGKGIKSLLLDEILPQLNTRADYFGSVLLDNEIRMEFDTETALKSGETRDKFNIKLFINEEIVEYKSCSSGEKGRIDAAVLLALQGLIFERSDCASSLVIFDEVFEHLDNIGVERMVNLLNEEAAEKAIFVISHISEFADYFDNVLMVKKKKETSVLEA